MSRHHKSPVACPFQKRRPPWFATYSKEMGIWYERERERETEAHEATETEPTSFPSSSSSSLPQTWASFKGGGGGRGGKVKSVGALRVRAHSHSEVMCTICVRQLKQEKYARQQQWWKGGRHFEWEAQQCTIFIVRWLQQQMLQHGEWRPKRGANSSQTAD